MTSLRVGQRVVCVDDSAGDGAIWAPGEAVLKGSVYTIRSIHIEAGKAILQLEEIERSEVSKIYHDNPMLGYRAARFRPVTERKTDISCFTSMLHTQRVRVPA